MITTPAPLTRREQAVELQCALADAVAHSLSRMADANVRDMLPDAYTLEDEFMGDGLTHPLDQMDVDEWLDVIDRAGALRLP